MALTRQELARLKELLAAQEINNNVKSLLDYESDDKNPNYTYLYKCWSELEYDSNDKVKKGKIGVVMEGSSRSGKTFSCIEFLVCICLHHAKNSVVNIVKETYNEFKTTLYNDFNKILPKYGIISPFESAKEVGSFWIGSNKINFLGADKPSKFHGAQCDYLYINEALPVSQTIFNQAEMRCSKFWFMDYNPSVTQHWIFNSVITRPEVGFIHTTFRDNPHVSIQEKNKILSYEPTEENKKNNTADDFEWKVYGLGKRGVMKGLIYRNVDYVDEFPEDLPFIYGMDFGFVSDPTAIVKFYMDEKDVYVELLCYESKETSKLINEHMYSIGIQSNLPIIADSSDRFVSEKHGVVRMVKELKHDYKWNIKKVSKTKSKMFHIGKLQHKKIHVVKSGLYNHLKNEFETYRTRQINGIDINQPIDGQDHALDAMLYASNAWEKSSRSVEVIYS